MAINIPEEYLQNKVHVPNSNLVFDPQQGTFEEFVPEGDPVQGLFAWDRETVGLNPLGSNTPSAVIDPFLQIKEEYQGGQPIQAETWQDAVRKSLAGFMRAEYGFDPVGEVTPKILDPIFNFGPDSGLKGSQFRMGTLQELVNELPGFYATGGSIRDLETGGITGIGENVDPLMGLQPLDKVLAFEDVPFEQVEKLVGEMPGQFVDTRGLAPLQKQYGELKEELAKVQEEHQQDFEYWQETGFANPMAQSRERLLQLQRQINNLGQQINENALLDLPEARSQMADFNDFLFKLDIGQYTTPEELVKAQPEEVLDQFFDTPAYRLAFGNEEEVLDPTAGPHERFRFDPGYQFQQEEGIRQLLQNHAAKGLLESGRSLRDVTAYAQNLADQSYQRWLAQNQQLFQNWQQQLAGVAQQGAQFSGPGPALSTGGALSGNEMAAGGNLAQIAQGIAQALGATSMQTGSALGNLAAGTGTNIASALQNQGFFGGQAFLDTGAAQANSILQAAAIQAQMEAAQSASGGGGGKGGGALSGAGQLLGAAGSFF